MKVNVEITHTEVYKTTVEVEAENAREAEEKACDNYNNNEYSHELELPDEVSTDFRAEGYPIDYNNILTDDEKHLMSEYSGYIHWGFTPDTIRAEFWHWKTGDLKEKAKVCYLLEDCNFHTLCGLLSTGDEKSALEWIDKEMPFED